MLLEANLEKTSIFSFFPLFSFAFELISEKKLFSFLGSIDLLALFSLFIFELSKLDLFSLVIKASILLSIKLLFLSSLLSLFFLFISDSLFFE